MYAEIRNKATRQCRSAKIGFEKEIAKNIKSDNKSFWNYVRSQTNTRVGISDLQSNDGTLTSSDAQKAELLNAFFSSVFTEENTSNIPNIESSEFERDLDSIVITPILVEKKQSSLI